MKRKPHRSVSVAVDRAVLRTRYPEVFPVSPLPFALKAICWAIPVVLLVAGLAWLGFSPSKLYEGLGRLGIILGLMFPPSPGPLLPVYLHSLVETLSIALLGTLLAAIIAFPLGFLAAQNVIPGAIFHFSIRRIFDGVRGIDTLIWALIFINVVGLGPFAGVLAVAMSDTASLGKLFSEAIEAADHKPGEGVTSTGGSRLHVVRFGLLPTVLPVMISQVLYYFESNTRSATVIGIVGAGGIGLFLSNEISQQNWDRVAFIILMILGTVGAIDWVSARLRRSLS